MEVLLLFWLGFALVIAVAASNRGRSGVGWFFLAILISPLLAGLFLLAAKDLKLEQAARKTEEVEAAGTKVCPKCAERVKKAALICRFCGNEFAPPDVAKPIIRVAPSASPLDPYAFGREGELALRERLTKLNTAQLCSVAVECGMDRNGYSHRWRDSDIIDHITRETIKQLRQDGVLVSSG